MEDRFRKLQELAIPLPTESTVAPDAGSASASPNAEATAGYYININNGERLVTVDEDLSRILRQ